MATTPITEAIQRRLAQSAAPQLYSTRQTARQLGVSPSTLTRAERRGAIEEVPKERHGPARTYTDADIQRLRAVIIAGRIGRR